MRQAEWAASWQLLRASFPASGLSGDVAERVWFSAFRAYSSEVFNDAVRSLARTTTRPSIAELDVLCRQIAPSRQPLLTTPQPSEERSGETYQERLQREELNYELALVATQAQLDHEARCGVCRTYAEPSGIQDHLGEPCSTGKVFWAPYHRLNGGRWSIPRDQVRRKVA